jgi:pimeloyl-ACP methyl ester carboxylesterase
VVYLNALPFIGPIMLRLVTPVVIELLPGLQSKDDVELFRRARLDFIDSCFAEPEKVPLSTRWSWLGSTLAQSSDDCQYVLSRSQDPAKLFEAGAQGLPLLIVRGSADAQRVAGVLEEEMKPFTNQDIYTIEGGAHAAFYEKQEEFVGVLLEFVRNTQVSWQFLPAPERPPNDTNQKKQ